MKSEMERDFLGLNWKDSSSMAEGKSEDLCKNSVADPQWPFSPKMVSPPLLPFKATQGCDQRKCAASMSDLPLLTGFAFDQNIKPPCFPKKNSWTVPVLDKGIPDSSDQYLVNKAAMSAQNLAAASMKQQSLGGIWVEKPRSISATNGFMNGFDHLRTNAKLSGLPSTLTIFYSGAVHVYHDISSEKAEAIMCMAGKGSSMNTAETKQMSKPVAEDNCKNQPPQPLNAIVNSTEKISATFKAGGLPMARKASLARFMEKRKDRLIDVKPYKVTEKLLDIITPQASKTCDIA